MVEIRILPLRSGLVLYPFRQSRRLIGSNIVTYIAPFSERRLRRDPVYPVTPVVWIYSGGAHYESNCSEVTLRFRLWNAIDARGSGSLLHVSSSSAPFSGIAPWTPNGIQL